MIRRIAGAMSMLVFAVCLVTGTQAGNTFGTTISRALIAMAVTLVIGLVVGAMAQAMLNENIGAEEKKLKNNAANPATSDR
jgi:hypothetical protein